ncbi:GAP family protein [Kitasatospora sp. MAP5-34]|uniref:GAP family protein n=1 Tax=Kitasatospora sp. MAP5-34 TaxID=3035102 RepID=UPI0024768CCD|nr:GAP family protein [Kitasatospora sp. MAP5-34]
MGIALGPLPLAGVIMLLAGPRGRVGGAAFVLGWVVALSAVCSVVVLVGSGLDTAGPHPPWSYWLELALGGALLVLGAVLWRARPREGQVHRPPTWMRSVDLLTPAKAAGLAATLVLADPKNLALAVGGGISVAIASADGRAKTVAVVLMVLVGSLGTLVPLAVHLLGLFDGTRSAKVLGEWKAWASVHSSAITLVVLIVLGTEYVGAAISGLTV